MKKLMILFVCCVIPVLALSSCTTYELVVPVGFWQSDNPAIMLDITDEDRDHYGTYVIDGEEIEIYIVFGHVSNRLFVYDAIVQDENYKGAWDDYTYFCGPWEAKGGELYFTLLPKWKEMHGIDEIVFTKTEPPIPETEPVASNDDSSSLPYIPPTIFDFSELSEEDFPRGTWTVNQLIDKYGEPERLYGWPGSNSLSVGIELYYKDVRVLLASWEAELFSPYESIKENWPDASPEERTFELSGQDKNIELTVTTLWFYENTVEFPRNIMIGDSTKQNVLDAYLEEPFSSDTWYTDQGEVAYYDCITYLYESEGDFGNGDISYFFDENGILWRIDIAWFWGC